MSRDPRRLSSLPFFLVGVLALVIAMGGAATAGALITSKQIKDNTVTTKDIKDGTLLLKDVKKSEVAKLKGKAGINGTNGAAGASAFEPPPSGTVIKGGGRLDGYVNAGAIYLYSYAPLPFTTAALLDDFAAGRNLFLGASALNQGGETDPAGCPGTFDAPTAAAGKLCVYLGDASNVASGTVIVYAGSDAGTVDAASNNGFFVAAGSNVVGNMGLSYVWVYTAP